MSTNQENGIGPADLQQAIQHSIVQRTKGRIRSLEVLLSVERIEIRGRAARRSQHSCGFLRRMSK